MTRPTLQMRAALAAEQEDIDRRDRISKAEVAVEALTNDERTELFAAYCRGCGGPSGCSCWRDE